MDVEMEGVDEDPGDPAIDPEVEVVPDAGDDESESLDSRSFPFLTVEEEDSILENETIHTKLVAAFEHQRQGYGEAS